MDKRYAVIIREGQVDLAEEPPEWVDSSYFAPAKTYHRRQRYEPAARAVIAHTLGLPCPVCFERNCSAFGVMSPNATITRAEQERYSQILARLNGHEGK